MAEMTSAKSVDEARARAARLLQAFEQAVLAAEAQVRGALFSSPPSLSQRVCVCCSFASRQEKWKAACAWHVFGKMRPRNV